MFMLNPNLLGPSPLQVYRTPDGAQKKTSSGHPLIYFATVDLSQRCVRFLFFVAVKHNPRCNLKLVYVGIYLNTSTIDVRQ